MHIKKVNKQNITVFADILKEAANWLISENMKNWDPSQFSIEKITQKNNIDELYLCFIGDEAVGCLKLQDKDDMFWPEDVQGESLYVHKLAVRREFAGKGISTFMLNWAKEQAKKKKCKYLKLDCIADREKLCSYYESQGFKKVDERLIFGKYPTAFYRCKL